MTTNIANFRENCASFVDMVYRSQTDIVITKHGKPVAKVTPVGPLEPKPYIGSFTNVGRTKGDLTEPLSDDWESNQ